MKRKNTLLIAFILTLAGNTALARTCLDAYDQRIHKLNKILGFTAVGGLHVSLAATMAAVPAGITLGVGTAGALIAIDVKRENLKRSKAIIEGAYNLDVNQTSEEFEEAYAKINRSLKKSKRVLSKAEYAKMLMKADQAQVFCPVTGTNDDLEDKRSPWGPKKIRKYLLSQLGVDKKSIVNVDDVNDQNEDAVSDLDLDKLATEASKITQDELKELKKRTAPAATPAENASKSAR